MSLLQAEWGVKKTHSRKVGTPSGPEKCFWQYWPPGSATSPKFWGARRHGASGVPMMPPQHLQVFRQLHGCSHPPTTRLGTRQAPS